MSEPALRPALGTADIQRIMQLLPHRPPMLMIDRVVDIVPGESATGIKQVSVSEPVFAGHFPGNPVFPGVLIVEAMAQTAGVVVMEGLGANNVGKVVLFMTIDRARFRAPIGPGDTVEMPVRLERSRPPVWKFSGEARVNGRLCAEAEFSAMIAGAKPNG